MFHRVFVHTPIKKHRTITRLLGSRVIISTNVPLDMKRDISSIKTLTKCGGHFYLLAKRVRT